MSAFLPAELIRRKRDGERLDAQAIEALVAGITSGALADAQVGALAMAIYFQGMDMGERVALTRAMTHSGAVLDWGPAGSRPPVIDKHSTGGIGDKVSLVLAPALAACGAWVPMISGRGLGHTGGTLDKLEAIPGYRCEVDLERLRTVVTEAGCAIVGAGDDLAPADRRLYAVRDVTATVESVALITASILAKKLAEGIDVLVMDVKTGSGAFAASLPEARELATSIVDVASGAGVDTAALITDMGAVLGRAAGNAVEVIEALAFLRGDARDERLCAVVHALGAEALVRARIEKNAAGGAARIARAIDDGSAAERFSRMVAALGGPPGLIDAPDRHLPRAPLVRPASARRTGHVSSVDARALGLAIVELGGGRRAPGDRVDAAVGITEALGPGDPVTPDRPLALVHGRDAGSVEEACERIRRAYRIADDAPAPVHPVLEWVGAGPRK